MSVDDASDDDAYRTYALALADAVDAALEGWVQRCVTQRIEQSGGSLDAPTRAATADAAARCRDEIGPAVRSLVLSDPDEQRGTPLTLLRAAVAYPTQVLDFLGVAPVERDEFQVTAFPDDPYDLTPTSFAEVDPALQDAGLAWGAAKAHVHLMRRRAEGRR